MKNATKAGGSRGFRPKGKTAERLDYADTLGLNVSELVNEVLENHLRTYLEKRVEEHRAKIQTLSSAIP